MNRYWSIPGPSKAPHVPCTAFYKYDGQNIRLEWSKKRGWYKFASRNELRSPTDAEFGVAMDIFQEKYGDNLPKVFTDHKDLRAVRSVIVFCELYGENSFAGMHVPGEPLDVILIDINPHKKGILVPRDFVRIFGHLDIAKVVYEGNFNEQFVEDVRAGKYNVKEGVVAKGTLPGKNHHSLWMTKVKSRWWMEELRRRAETQAVLRQTLRENLVEQEQFGG
jgi:hypothetical protein